MKKLKEEQRICLEMMYLEQMSYVQIAEETTYTLKQVKSYIQNGKRNLKNMMSQE
jgi:RNA polymerase sigma-70 factor (ECF subfamily)